jgi:hypothetical protein
MQPDTRLYAHRWQQDALQIVTATTWSVYFDQDTRIYSRFIIDSIVLIPTLSLSLAMPMPQVTLPSNEQALARKPATCQLT